MLEFSYITKRVTRHIKHCNSLTGKINGDFLPEKGEELSDEGQIKQQ